MSKRFLEDLLQQKGERRRYGENAQTVYKSVYGTVYT